MAFPEPGDHPELEEENGPQRRQLHPLPRGLVELYGLLAVLFVLVPEWMAGGALAGFREGREGSELPVTTRAWQKLPELRLATMGMAQLRLLARRQRIRGYTVLGRDRLTLRLLRRLRRRGDGPGGL
jgi:hypothetical protein